MSYFPEVKPFPADGDPDFNAKSHECMDSMRVASVEANARFAQLDAAVTTATAGLAAGLWAAGTYAIGTLKFSTVNGFLYRRTVATASAVDPGTDATGWELQTSMGFPIVLVNTALHDVAPRTCCLVVYAGACTLRFPASPGVQFECEIRLANGRWDNVADGNGNKVEQQTDTLYLDSGDANGRWRYFSVDLGYGRG